MVGNDAEEPRGLPTDVHKKTDACISGNSHIGPSGDAREIKLGVHIHSIRTRSLDGPLAGYPAPVPSRLLHGTLRSASPPVPRSLLHHGGLRAPSPPPLRRPFLQNSALRSASPPFLQSSALRSASPPVAVLTNGLRMGTGEQPALSQSNSSASPSLPGSKAFFGVLPKLEYRLKKSCECCSVPGDSLITSFPEVPLRISGIRKLNLPADSFSQELWAAFGPSVWKSLVGDITADEIIPLEEAGLNHVFTAKVRTWFVKAVNFESAATSEAQHMEYLTRAFPTLVNDPTLVFPTKWCRVVTPECSYDVLVYPYVSGKNVREVVLAYEHSSKERKKYLKLNMVTLIRCCAELLRRYHLVHGRKHGDAKADNFMVTVQGHVLLCDHGVNTLALCDKSEFIRSLICLDPEVAKLKTMFGSFFNKTSDIRYVCDDDRTQIREVLRYLTQLNVPADAVDDIAEECVRQVPTPNFKNGSETFLLSGPLAAPLPEMCAKIELGKTCDNEKL